MTTNRQKIALVTGGASGLGLAISKRFVKEGIYTILIGRNDTRLRAAQRLLGKNSKAIRFDLTQLDQIPALISKIKEEFSSIDILVNNAGIHLKKRFKEVSDHEFQEVILTNLTAVFSLSREVSVLMSKQGSGNILHISSMAAQYGIPKVIAYTAAKAGIEGMTRAMAVELSPMGIKVNCIAPGFIQTNMSSGALKNDSKRSQKALSRTPLGFFGKPEDIANAAYFLTSEEAQYITGSIFNVDGGNAVGF